MREPLVRRVLAPAAIELDQDSKVRREFSRDSRFVDRNYLANYDDATVFYDCIVQGSDVVCVGPPLLNLEPAVRSGSYAIDGAELDGLCTRRQGRTQVTTLKFSRCLSSGEIMSVRLAGISRVYKITLSGGDEDTELFAGHRTLVTMQKNEELAWVRDWLVYYAQVHGATAAIIYDNGSTAYSAEQLLSAAGEVGEIGTIIVMRWPFKYGPQGAPWAGPDVPWDSDFCQIGGFQDARFRFLAEAKSIVNVDVDELVVPAGKGSGSVFEAVEAVTSGGLSLKGHWVENVAVGLSTDTVPRFWNFPYVRGAGEPCGRKWAAVPSRWPEAAVPTPHDVRKVESPVSDDFYLGHFRGLNSGWKNPARSKARSKADDDHLDPALWSALGRAFPAEVSRQGAVLSGWDVSPLRGWLLAEVKAKTRQAGWEKVWIWNDKVVVFELSTPLGRVVFDVHLDSLDDPDEISVAAVVRNLSNLGAFQRLAQEHLGAGDEINKPNGVWLGKWSVKKEGREKLRDAVAAAILPLARRFSSYSSRAISDLVESFGPPTQRRVRWPLSNLRQAASFEQLAEEMRKSADGRPLLYVPNQGNWGDALIHKGTLQFLDANGFDYRVATRREAEAMIVPFREHSGQISDSVLVSGGGGSWRHANSGNLSFMQRTAPYFRKAIVLPHTFEAGALRAPDTEITYFSRDASMSLRSIPSAFPVHDMAFYLQLPELMRGTTGLGTGFFLRNDPEKNALSVPGSNSNDLSRLGTHRSQVTPFFQLIESYDRVVTDRMHIAIASAMLGKPTALLRGNYGKAEAVYEQSLKTRFPNVRLVEW